MVEIKLFRNLNTRIDPCNSEEKNLEHKKRKWKVVKKNTTQTEVYYIRNIK